MRKPVQKSPKSRVITRKRWPSTILRVLSRHPSHKPLRNERIRTSVPTVLRLGSETDWRRAEIEINTVAAVQNSASKSRMKRCFIQAGVITPKFYTRASLQRLTNAQKEEALPIIGKRVFGSRAQGMVKLDTLAQLNEFLATHNNGYLYEEFVNYSREYRLHVSTRGVCFYSCRKMLRNEITERRWLRNDSNSNWIMETTTELFNKPVTWNAIVADCVRALNAVGLDVGACDVKVAKDGRHSIIEINSAPSFGDITLQKYITEVKELIKIKS